LLIFFLKKKIFLYIFTKVTIGFFIFGKNSCIRSNEFILFLKKLNARIEGSVGKRYIDSYIYKQIYFLFKQNFQNFNYKILKKKKKKKYIYIYIYIPLHDCQCILQLFLCDNFNCLRYFSIKSELTNNNV